MKKLRLKNWTHTKTILKWSRRRKKNAEKLYRYKKNAKYRIHSKRIVKYVLILLRYVTNTIIIQICWTLKKY